MRVVWVSAHQSKGWHERGQHDDKSSDSNKQTVLSTCLTRGSYIVVDSRDPPSVCMSVLEDGTALTRAEEGREKKEGRSGPRQVQTVHLHRPAKSQGPPRLYIY